MASMQQTRAGSAAGGSAGSQSLGMAPNSQEAAVDSKQSIMTTKKPIPHDKFQDIERIMKDVTGSQYAHVIIDSHAEEQEPNPSLSEMLHLKPG